MGRLQGEHSIARGTFEGEGPRPGWSYIWRVEIRKKMDPWDTELDVHNINLDFPGEGALKIEWDTWRPEEAVHGSRATLRIISPSDRTFINMISGQAGVFRLLVYRRRKGKRDETLVWSGTLDPLFYSEPYQRLNDYELELTFSDFGALDRCDFNLGEAISWDYTEEYGNQIPLADIITGALWKARMIDDRMKFKTHIGYITKSGLRVENVKGSDYGDAIDLNYITISHRNFYDEEGKPMTWREVLEAVLLPLNLHITQRTPYESMVDACALIYDPVYFRNDAVDLHPWLIHNAHWTSDEQTLSAADLAERVTVKFSPYSKPDLYESGFRPGYVRKTATYKNAIVRGSGVMEARLFDSFRMSASEIGTYGTPEDRSVYMPWWESGPMARFVHIESLLGKAPDTDALHINTNFIKARIKAINSAKSFAHDGAKLINGASCSMNIPEPATDSTGKDRFKLQLTIDMLFDQRYNPFEDAHPEKDNADKSGSKLWNYGDEFDEAAHYGWMLLPMKISITGNKGEGTYIYTNQGAFMGAHLNKETDRIEPWKGRWIRPYKTLSNGKRVNYPETTIARSCFAQFYADNGGENPLAGFSTNRATIGVWPKLKKLPAFNAALPDGMSIPYPPISGMLHIDFYNVVLSYGRDPDSDTENYKNEGFNGIMAPWYGMPTFGNIYDKMWWLIKEIKVNLVENDYACSEIEAEDVEVLGSAMSDELAFGSSEEVSVDTTCGTVKEFDPTMRGLLMFMGSPIKEATRFGETKSLESALVSALLGQYADRRAVISGEALGIPGAILYRDHNSEEIFIMTSAALDAQTGKEELTITELLEEEYHTTADPEVPPVIKGDDPSHDDDTLEQHHPNDDFYDHDGGHDENGDDDDDRKNPWDDWEPWDDPDWDDDRDYE